MEIKNCIRDKDQFQHGGIGFNLSYYTLFYKAKKPTFAHLKKACLPIGRRGKKRT